MIEEILKQYADLKIKEKEIKEKIDELNPKIVEYLDQNDLDKQPTSLGTFSLVRRKDWQYTDAVKQVEQKVKDLKNKEQADGTATFIEKLSLMFKELKENE